MSYETYPCAVNPADALVVSMGSTDHVFVETPHDEIVLSRTSAAQLHQQLGRWLGANPTGIVDRCPGSGQPPASVDRYGRRGVCSVCGDKFVVTGRTGLIYKHRRRTP